MRRKKKHQNDETSENSERWLLTYSDMITLLLALFIILYSISSINSKKFAEIAESFGQTMGTVTNATGSGSTSESTSGSASSGTSSGSSSGGSDSSLQTDALDEIYIALSDYVKENNLSGSLKLENTASYVRVQLKDVLMFQPDSATMLPASQPVVQKIEDAISQVYDRLDHITISGYTAEVGEQTTAAKQFSWQLSTDRAVTVLNELISCGLPEEKLSIEGYSHFSPVANNNTEEGRAQNRRVEITIYKYPETEADASASP